MWYGCGKGLKELQKSMYQTSRVECGQHVDIARICLSTLINNNYVESMKLPSFPQKSMAEYGQFHIVQKNAKKILCHRVLGTGMLFLSLLLLQIFL